MDELTFGHDLLQRAASATAYPATPELRGAVLRAIAAPRRHTASPRFGFAAALAIIAAFVIGVIASVLAIPSSRGAVADLFDIEGSNIEVLPTAPVGTTPTPFPTPRDIDQNAVPSSLERAAVAAGFEPALLNSAPPREVYVAQYGERTGIILRYDEFDLWEVGGAGDFTGSFGKGVPADGRIIDLMVNDVPGTWITGASHFVYFQAVPEGERQEESRVVERNTLIWRTSFALYRLETNFELADALRIAESLP